MDRNSFKQWTQRCRPLRRTLTAQRRAMSGVALGLLLAAGIGVRPAAAQNYTVTDLGTLGGSDITVTDINNLGQVVGYGETANAGEQRGFLFDGTLHPLGTFGGKFSYAEGINDAGQIVGTAATADGLSDAFLYDHGLMTALSLPAGKAYAASAINSLGQIIFFDSGGSDQPRHTFFYSGGVARDLGTLPGYPTPSAADLNDAGQVVGTCIDTDHDLKHGFIWQDGVMTDLGTLGGKVCYAKSINSAGQVVGGADTAAKERHAFLWQAGVMTDLGTFPSQVNDVRHGRYSHAFGINSSGQVVGDSEAPDTDTMGEQHAFLYTGGRMLDLNDLIPSNTGWLLRWAVAINDRGQIVGQGQLAGTSSEHTGGGWRAFLLTPTPAPIVRLRPGLALNLGNLPVGSTSAGQTITVSNLGNAPLAIQSQKLVLDGENPGDFIVTPDLTGSTVLPGESRILTVRLAPRSGGGHIATFTLATNALHSPDTLRLGGNGIPRLLNVSQSSLGFGDQRVGTSSAEQAVTARNIGEIPLAISSVKLTGDNSSDFVITADSCTGATFNQNAAGTVRIAFNPKAPGNRTALLTISSDAQGSPHTIALSGHGTASAVRLSPARLGFGSQPVGTSNNTQTILLQNKGDAPLDIQGVQLTGTNPGDFAITADGWTGVHLLPGEVALLNLRFTPMEVGSRSASLTVHDSALDSPQSLPLSGNGAAAAVSLSPGSLNFTDQLVGTTSTEQTLTLTNTGDAPLTIHGVHFTGSNAGDFTAATDLSGGVLAPGQSRTLPVRFAPTAAGSRTASLAVSDSAADSPHTMALSGNGTASSVTFGISRLDRPTRVSFGEQPVGTTGAAQTLTVTNGGTGALTISSVRITGANAGDFALSADSGGPILAPGASRNFTLRFKPTGKGSRSASLTMSDNALGSPHTVALQGMGLLVPPAAPAGLEIQGITSKQIQLTWVPGSPDTTSYAIWRKVGNGEFERCGGVSGMLNRFVDRHVSVNTTYTYRVRANGPGGVSGWSAEAGGTTPPAPPVAPTGLTARALSASEVDLAWTDNSSDETSFALWRKSGTGAWARVGGVSANVSRYVDKNLAPNTSYTYEVRANSAGGVSEWSNQAMGKTLAH